MLAIEGGEGDYLTRRVEVGWWAGAGAAGAGAVRAGVLDEAVGAAAAVVWCSPGCSAGSPVLRDQKPLLFDFVTAC